MFCGACGTNILESARFCISCGNPISHPSVQPVVAVNIPVSQVAMDISPSADPDLRNKLLECYLDFSTSQELSDWLRDIGQDPRGTVEEKRVRIQQHTKYLSMSPQDFPKQTISYLRQFSRVDLLADICEQLGLSVAGTKDSLFRRIYREVGYREQWLPKPSLIRDSISKQNVLPFVRWYPILRNRDYEKDYYEEFFDEMSEVFGEENVHQQVPIAHGSTLKIDFHLGHPTKEGVGVEFKMPTNNGEIQRALGQVDQYISRYGSELIIVVIPDFLDSKTQVPMFEGLKSKGIETVSKTKND